MTIGFILLFLNDTYKEITSRFLSQTLFLPYYTAIDMLPAYRQLKTENEELHQKIIQLSIQNEQAKIALAENKKLKQFLQFRKGNKHHFVSARIISEFYKGRSRSFVLDKGTESGIRLNDAVIILQKTWI